MTDPREPAETEPARQADPPPGGSPGDGPAERELDGLPPPPRGLALALRLYKDLFMSAWFDALCSEVDVETRRVLERIREDTGHEARETVRLAREWGACPGQAEAVEATTRETLTHLLEDMLRMKEKCTEAFLSAGIRAPTQALRQEFLGLADLDRRHADALRHALGMRFAHEAGLDASLPEAEPSGASVGPFAAGTLSRCVQEAVDRAHRSGHPPARLVMSGLVLRHLRDEGAVGPRVGTVFGVPVDVDFSWKGEVFALLSWDRRTLAEIVTEMHGNQGAEHP